jgi:hypothetical protein
MKALRKAIDLRAPGLPIVPSMSAGATDSLYFRNIGVPSYGVGGPLHQQQGKLRARAQRADPGRVD